ncbi:YopX family protein [Bacillus subtilis]|uniref:YopX family protein n=1 Tax=Bacillus subtilis TaxID=1423 RepID=UPI0011A5F3B0|nr:YopX family protein [Bacillus subtilis]MED1761526.1 YopX family protein [Bacillus subtilis]
MRQIKFRAWHKKWDRLINDIFLGDSEVKFPIGNTSDILDINEEYSNLIFQQYTGLKDKNGREIYEGDHLFSQGNMDGIDYVGTVTYCENDAKYVLENVHGRLEWIPNNECWVKGNIYENPELQEASHASK